MEADILEKPKMVTFGVTLWVSFMFAAGATMLFFAAFDPVEISKVATFPMQLNRLSGYSLGFLLFWLLLIVNSYVVISLLTQKPSGHGVNSSQER